MRFSTISSTALRGLTLSCLFALVACTPTQTKQNAQAMSVNKSQISGVNISLNGVYSKVVESTQVPDDCVQFAISEADVEKIFSRKAKAMPATAQLNQLQGANCFASGTMMINGTHTAKWRIDQSGMAYYRVNETSYQVRCPSCLSPSRYSQNRLAFMARHQDSPYHQNSQTGAALKQTDLASKSGS
jgi:hypothetical protein